jgi:hypothetical protein
MTLVAELLAGVRLGSVRPSASRRVHRAAARLRRRHYAGGGTSFGSALSIVWQRRLGLDDPSAVGSRKVEVGSGTRPQPGYIHVDVDPWAWHVEYVASAWDLPLADEWAEEILAIHSLEHVPPKHLSRTLAEWRRVLAPEGLLRVHVPNAPGIMNSFEGSPVSRKWALMGAVLGMYNGPEVSSPAALQSPADHQILFDAALLREVLVEAGFRDVRDVTGEVADIHSDEWKGVVPDLSIVFHAVK